MKQLRVVAIIASLFVAACDAGDPASQPQFYVPPDPAARPVAFVEVKRDFGVLGGISLLAVDGQRVRNPAYIAERQQTEATRRAVRRQAWSDGSDTLFLAVPPGERQLGYFYLPGMRLSGFNPFDPPDTLVPVAIEGTLRPGRLYRARAEDGPQAHSYRFWLEDIATGETIASTIIQ